MKRATLATSGVLLLLLAAVPAAAHDPAQYFPYQWRAADLPNITYRFTQGVPTGAFRDRVEDGGTKWTDVANANINFVRSGVNEPNFNWLSCSAGPAVSTIHYKILTSAYAQTKLCVNTQTGNISNFRIAFDTQDGWNTGTGAPTALQVDLWVMATHEFGHAGGGWVEVGTYLGQYNNTELCPRQKYDDWHTMCNSVDVLEGIANGEYGLYFRRTLLTHDIDVWQMKY